MAHFCGRLLVGAEVFLERVEGDLEEHTYRDGARSWAGHFGAPAGHAPDPRETYTLALDDGRSGNLQVLQLDAGRRQGTVAYFKGRGPLSDAP